ncbi:MAG: type II toxin-antitoxin system Phd/YefM family antitoxin [Pseudomonadota bacterium]|nr:type II toxin-antitoxin system Phd/YefM family antitoxin [Pseudomonadota bacterium]
MAMHTVTATELKNRLGRYLDAAIAEPVIIEKSGRETAVLMSKSRYDELQAMEDELWALRAQLAEREGYLSVEETARALRKGADDGA